MHREVGGFEVEAREIPVEGTEIDTSTRDIFDRRNHFLSDEIVELRTA